MSSRKLNCFPFIPSRRLAHSLTLLLNHRTWCAGGISSGATGIQEEFGVSSEVTTLCLPSHFMSWDMPLVLCCLLRYRSILAASLSMSCRGFSYLSFSSPSHLRQTSGLSLSADSLQAELEAPR
jgi:hypothetical protein